MSLSPEFLEYPARRHGMDHDRYEWSNLFDRRPIQWSNGADLALLLVIPLEFFSLEGTSGKPFKAPGGMMTPYPDYRHYSSRDYGNRVGIFRLFNLLETLNLKATIPVNSVLAERYPALIAEINRRGHEIMAHGIDMDALHYGGLDEETEARYVETAVTTLRERSGQAIRGWLSPAFSQSFQTPDLLTRFGIEYAGDWGNDELPYLQRTQYGPLVAMPVSQELNDRQIIMNYHSTEDSFAQQILDAYNWLHRESKQQGGRVLSLTLHPYISGLPYRIRTLKTALQTVMSGSGVWSATGSEIVDELDKQAYFSPNQA